MIKAPSYWKKGTNAPYYRASYAAWLKPLLDRIENEPDKPAFIDAKTLGIEARTLLNKVSQAWLYLIDNCDTPEGKYKALREALSVELRGNMLRIYYKRCYKEEGTLLDNAKFSSKEDSLLWRETFDTFMETSMKEGDVLELVGLNLTNSDLDYIKELVESTDNFVVRHLDNTSFKVELNSRDAERKRRYEL